MTRMLRSSALLLMVVALPACAITQVSEPDLADIPSGPAEVVGGGVEAIGEVTVLGAGRADGVGWRYSVFESTDGTCRQVETAVMAMSECGHPTFNDTAFASVGVGESGHGFWIVDGVVRPDVEAVWLTTDDGRRVAAELLPLTGDGARAFIAISRTEARPERLTASGADGGIIELYDLP